MVGDASKGVQTYLINVDCVDLLHAPRHDRTQRLDSTLVVLIFLRFLAESTHITLFCEIHILGPTTLDVTHTGTLCDQSLRVGFVF